MDWQFIITVFCAMVAFGCMVGLQLQMNRIERLEIRAKSHDVEIERLKDRLHYFELGIAYKEGSQ